MDLSSQKFKSNSFMIRVKAMKHLVDEDGQF